MCAYRRAPSQCSECACTAMIEPARMLGKEEGIELADLGSALTEGLISRSSPRSISITSWEKLAAAGDFDSSHLYLHEAQAAFA